MNIYKDKDESIKQYKVRLCENKDIYGLTFSQIAELINKETGESKSESFFRRWWNGYSEGYNDGIHSDLNRESINEEYDRAREELEKEKIKFFDYRMAYKKEIRDSSRKEIIDNILLDTISKIKPYEIHNIESIQASNNDLLIGLNDIHYGANISNYWNTYNSDIAKTRLGKYLKEIFRIANTHHSENCYVCANGDFISGNIHPAIQIANRENVIEQVIGVSELISWFLSELSCRFKNVYFATVSGNHSRLSTKDNSPKSERLDDLIPWYIKARLQSVSNIFILDRDIDSTLNIINIRGKNYLNIHGDYDKFGEIYKLITMLPEKIYCVHLGHLHHNFTDFLYGYKIIMSGSLQGVDDFCIQKRLYGKAQQLVCVCTENGIDCTYDVDLQE